MPSTDSARKWIFVQQGGQKKRLELEGWSAPFGRPRAGAVVKDGVHMRNATTVYPDAVGEKTLHSFGADEKPIELKGRFRDRFGGKGYALAKRAEVDAFVRDGVPCHITWGDSFGVVGFLEDFDTGRESFGEIEWTLQIVVLSNDFAAQKGAAVPSVKPPKSILNAMIEALYSTAKAPSVPPELPPKLSDNLFDLSSSVGAATASLVDLSNQFAGFEKQLAADIRAFRYQIHQTRTAINQFRTTYDDLSADTTDFKRNPTGEQEFLGHSTTVDADLLRVIEMLNEADRQLLLAERGKIRGSYVARDGDTWERVSTNVYGAPDRAADLQLANGVPAGAQPAPGTSYLLPV